MPQIVILLVLALLPITTMAEEADTLSVLQAKLAAYYKQLLNEARAEDDDARKNNLPDKYADQERVLKDNQAAFETFMANECNSLSPGEATNCKINLITTRLTILGGK